MPEFSKKKEQNGRSAEMADMGSDDGDKGKEQQEKPLETASFSEQQQLRSDEQKKLGKELEASKSESKAESMPEPPDIQRLKED